jgi:hypothetical protein
MPMTDLPRPPSAHRATRTTSSARRSRSAADPRTLRRKTRCGERASQCDRDCDYGAESGRLCACAGPRSCGSACTSWASCWRGPRSCATSAPSPSRGQSARQCAAGHAQRQRRVYEARLLVDVATPVVASISLQRRLRGPSGAYSALCGGIRIAPLRVPCCQSHSARAHPPHSAAHACFVLTLLSRVRTQRVPAAAAVAERAARRAVARDRGARAGDAARRHGFAGPAPARALRHK